MICRHTHTRMLLPVAATVMAGVLLVAIPGVSAQQTPPAGRATKAAAAGRGDQLAAGEVQRLFDAWLIIQAQDALKLDDDQFVRFLPKLRALQETRRRHEAEHNQLVGELNRMTVPTATFDEALVRDKLKAIQDVDGRAAADIRKAYDAVDALLDVRRQARFRVFELQMERRKLDLLLRARAADAARIRDTPPEAIKKEGRPEPPHPGAPAARLP